MIINDVPYYLIRSLLFTIIIELLFALIIRIKDKKDLLNVLLVNVITNPFATIIPFIVNIKFGSIYRNPVLYLLEIIVIVVEGLIYKKVLKYKKINYLTIALILNLASFGIGEMINYLC